MIALFGIVNTLALSIFERTREIGLMRAIGMARSQVRAMIRWEAVIIAVFGAVLGIVIGVFFGWAMVQALKDQGITALSIPVGQLRHLRGAGGSGRRARGDLAGAARGEAERAGGHHHRVGAMKKEIETALAVLVGRSLRGSERVVADIETFEFAGGRGPSLACAPGPVPVAADGGRRDRHRLRRRAVPEGRRPDGRAGRVPVGRGGGEPPRRAPARRSSTTTGPTRRPSSPWRPTTSGRCG